VISDQGLLGIKRETLRGLQNRKVALVILLCSAPLMFVFAGPGRARPAAVCASAFGVTIWSWRNLRHKVWFWIVLVLLAAAHLPLILLVRWSDASLPVNGLIPIMLVDFAYVCAPIWLIENAMSRDPKVSLLTGW
jgi:hypothetical protein